MCFPVTTTWRLSRFGCRTLSNVAQICLSKASQRSGAGSIAEVSSKGRINTVKLEAYPQRAPALHTALGPILWPAVERPASAVFTTQQVQERQAAIVCMQAHWRSYTARMAYAKLQASVAVIQPAFRRWRIQKALKQFQSNHPAHVLRLHARVYQELCSNKDSTICELQGSLQRAVGLHSQAERCLLVSQETQYSLQKSRDGALHELRESGKAHSQAITTFQSHLGTQSKRALQAESRANALSSQLHEQHDKVVTIMRERNALQDENRALTSQLSGESEQAQQEAAQAARRHSELMADQLAELRRGFNQEMALMKGGHERALADQKSAALSAQQEAAVMKERLQQASAETTTKSQELEGLKQEIAALSCTFAGVRVTEADYDDAQAQLPGIEGLKQAVDSAQEQRRQLWDANCFLESHLAFIEEEEDDAQAKLQQALVANKHEAATRETAIARLQAVQEMAEAESKPLKASIASLQAQLKHADDFIARQNLAVGLLRQQLTDAQTVGQALMGEVRAMQARLDKPEAALQPEVSLPQQDDTAKLCQAPSASSPLRLSPKQKLSSDELAQASALLSSGSAAAVAQAAPQAATKPTADAAANDAQATTPASTAASATASMQSSVSGPSKGNQLCCGWSKKGKMGKAAQQRTATAGPAPVAVAAESAAAGSQADAASQGSTEGARFRPNLAADSKADVLSTVNIAKDLAHRSSNATPTAGWAQAGSGNVLSLHNGGPPQDSLISPPALSNDPLGLPAPLPAPAGPQKLASAWWGNRIKALQRAAGLSKKQVNGLTVLEAVPGAVGYWWPVEAAHRLLGSGGQGFVCYAEKWWIDAASGKVKKRPAALKVLPCETQAQLALLDREAFNIRAMAWEEEGRQVSAPYAPLLFDDFKNVDSRQGMLAMSLVEGKVLADSMSKAHEKMKHAKQWTETVVQVLQKLLQALADMNGRGGRCFGDLKPENVMCVGRKLVFIDWSSSRHWTQGAVEGAPNTLGYPAPEVTAQGLSQKPCPPIDAHKDDVWAVGVMGLLWLSKGQDMPFGPTRQQAQRLGHPNGLAEARKSVMAKHATWAQAHPGNASMGFPEGYNFLDGLPDAATRSKAATFFLSVLQPNPAHRVTAAEALTLSFLT